MARTNATDRYGAAVTTDGCAAVRLGQSSPEGCRMGGRCHADLRAGVTAECDTAAAALTAARHSAGAISASARASGISTRGTSHEAAVPAASGTHATAGFVSVTSTAICRNSNGHAYTNTAAVTGARLPATATDPATATNSATADELGNTTRARHSAADASGCAGAGSYRPQLRLRKGQTPPQTFVCSDAALSRADLEMAQPYCVLRQLVGRDGWDDLLHEAVGFQNQTAYDCRITDAGELPPVQTTLKTCLLAAYQAQRQVWLRRLWGRGLEEALRPIEQHIALQARLQALGYLPSTARESATGRTARNCLRSRTGRPRGLGDMV
jgi:hypothetical protein